MGPRLPSWLRKPETAFAAVHEIKRELRRRALHTVCESARCPNLHQCFQRGTATFMILGGRCTRSCGFCAVPKAQRPAPPDPAEP
ncbi:MAG: lipoyl synthase, partial [Bryobacteraceae bacterium]